MSDKADDKTIAVIVGVVIFVLILGVIITPIMSSFDDPPAPKARHVVSFPEGYNQVKYTLREGDIVEIQKPIGYCVYFPETTRPQPQLQRQGKLQTKESYFLKARSTGIFNFRKVPFSACQQRYHSTRSKFEDRGMGVIMSGKYTLPFSTHFQQWTPALHLVWKCTQYTLPDFQNGRNYQIQYKVPHQQVRGFHMSPWQDYYPGQEFPYVYMRFKPLVRYATDPILELRCDGI